MTKVKTTTVSRKDSGQRVGTRKPGTLLEQYAAGASLEELNLTEAEVMALIDHAAQVEETRRKVAEECTLVVEPTKSILKEVAKRDGWKHKVGKIGECKISPYTKTITGTPEELAKILKKEGKLKMFNSLVSIKITDCKKFLGEDILFSSGLFHTETEPYGTISIKALKSK